MVPAAGEDGRVHVPSDPALPLSEGSSSRSKQVAWYS